MKVCVGNFDHLRPLRKLININGKPTIDSTRYLLFGINSLQKHIIW